MIHSARSSKAQSGGDRMSEFMVDVEFDGPIPGNYSMIYIGCVLVEEPLKRTFTAKLKPISEDYAAGFNAFVSPLRHHASHHSLTLWRLTRKY
jgi:hypothetical protein